MAVTTRQLQCAALLEKTYSPSGAAALVGNFTRESGAALPTAFRTGKLDHGSQGLAQWRLGRLDAYQAFVAAKHPDLTDEEDLWPWYGRMDYQVQFVVHEMLTDYPALHGKLVKGGDVAALVADVCWQYERPSKALSGIAYRIQAGKDVFAALPSVKRNAAPVDIASGLEIKAAEHTKVANTSTGSAIGAGVIGGAVVLHHVSHSLATWEWIALAIVGVIGIIAIVGAISEHAQAAAVKSAKAQVNTNVTPQPVTVVVAPTPSAIVKPADPAPGSITAADRAKLNAQKAADAEKASIDEAMAADLAGATKLTPVEAPAPPAPPAPPTT